MKSDILKKGLASTLKELSKTQPLSSVTVSALTKACGVSRGTFYYHFIDIYDLIIWTFQNDIIVPLQEHIRSHPQREWRGITEYCLQRMFDDKDFYCQATRLEGQNCLKDYMLEKNLESWLLLIGKYLEENKRTCDAVTLDFLTRFTSQAVGNMVVKWAQDGMTTPVALMAKVDDVATRGIYFTTTEKTGKSELSSTRG